MKDIGLKIAIFVVFAAVVLLFWLALTEPDVILENNKNTWNQKYAK